MAVTQKVTLYNNKFTVPPVINAVQNDTDRQVEAYFGDFTLQVGMTGKLSFIRSDGTHYEVSATLSTANNTATAELDQALTQAGVTQAQLKITDSGNVGSTFTFMIKVQPDVAGISQQQDGYSAEELAQAISDNTAAITNINNVELPKKADQDGYYEDLTSGTSLAVLGTPTTESVPYLFRRSASIGVRESDKIIGGTVAWNQLIKNGNFSNGTTDWITGNGTSAVSNNVLTATASGSDLQVRQIYDAVQNGHKFLVICGVKASASKEIHLRISQNSPVGNTVYKAFNTTANTHEVFSAILSASADLPNTRFSFYVATSANGETYQLDNFHVHNLTQALGRTIADYVHTLESGTAGAGIAWLRENGFGFMLDSYHAYDAGSLQSVKTSAHKTTGFNQWDGTYSETNKYLLESGAVNNGSNEDITSYIPVIAGETYYISPTYGNYSSLCWYDADKNYISGVSYLGQSSKTVTAPNGSAYLRATVYKANASVFCVSFSGSRNGQYEPYWQKSYPLSNIDLRGIPKLDGSNKLYYDGDSYASDGTVVRKYGTRAYQSGDESLVDAITDGTTTVYKLTTPTTETADAYQDPQICSPFGTEEYVDTRDVPVPVGHETEYYGDPVAEIERVSVQVPAPPTANGTYRLTCVVSGGVPTYSWTS